MLGVIRLDALISLGALGVVLAVLIVYVFVDISVTNRRRAEGKKGGLIGAWREARKLERVRRVDAEKDRRQHRGFTPRRGPGGQG